MIAEQDSERTASPVKKKMKESLKKNLIFEKL